MAPVPGRTPIERNPFAVGLDPMVVDFNFRVRAPKEGVPYRPMAPQAGVVYGPFNKLPQEDWGSVADKFSVDVYDLISFNFLTTNSDVVNWCLRVYVGCERVSPSGNNWMFSERARPGIIFIPQLKDRIIKVIPPQKDRTVNFAPENICVWTPQSEKSFMRKLDAIAQGLPGEKGKRIKRLMQVVLSTGSKDWRDLWYYNDMVIEMYVDWKVDNSERIKSTLETQGGFPFKGQAVWHVQGQSEAGGAERAIGMWRIQPFRKMFDDFCGDQEDFDAIKKRLWAIDEEMYKGWHEMELVSARSGLGGGGAYKGEIEDFIGHVSSLSRDKSHLYWAFGQ
jgi:hypothetical protein